jgi:hypothetical protein
MAYDRKRSLGSLRAAGEFGQRDNVLDHWCMMAISFFRRNLLCSAVSVVGSVTVRSAAHAAEQKMSIAELDVTVWRPDGGAAAAHPIIIFSHGFHGCATQSRFLMTAFAAAGYLVIAPNHRDATCNGGSAR